MPAKSGKTLEALGVTDVSERQTEPSTNHACSLQSFPRDSWSRTALSGSANDQREWERVVLDPFSNFL